MDKPKICLIGDVVIDVSLKSSTTETKMRLGGIIHAARCLWALDIPFSVGYFAPAYLDNQVAEYLASLNCHELYKLGNINGAPYVFLIEEVKEIGNQGYEFLLRDEIKIDYNEDSYRQICAREFEDYLLISGNYNLTKICNNLKGRIHIDLANNVDEIAEFDKVEAKLNTLFISTSSEIFSKHFRQDFPLFASLFDRYTQLLILKENRGGSRGYDTVRKNVFSVPSQTRPIVHSVGVGDVYDACFVAHLQVMSIPESMVLASWLAAEYADTTYPDDYKLNVVRLKKSSIDSLVSLGGVRLPWELRKSISIYIAAPDFEHIDTSPIDVLVDSLTYHNFNPRLPIRENGLMEANATKVRKQELFHRDIALLDKCQLLVAVLLYIDPGTLIEIGLAAAAGKPTIVYDPYRIAENCMLTELPTLVTDNLDEVIATVFLRSQALTFNE